MTNSLTHERLLALLRYDATTGVFTRLLKAPPRGNPGDIVGSPTAKGYLRVMIDTKSYYLHRLAIFYMTGVFPSLSVDHKDGDVTNNSFSNLREVTHSVNLQNLRQARKDSATGVIGVQHRKDTGKFVAKIFVRRKTLTLGNFSTLGEAEQAYLTAKRKHHEGCTL